MFESVAFCANATCLLLTILFVEFPHMLDSEGELEAVNDLLHFSAVTALIFVGLALLRDVKVD